MWRVDSGKKCVSHAKILQTVLETAKAKDEACTSFWVPALSRCVNHLESILAEGLSR